MKKVCPRCGVTFDCRHNEIMLCHCATVKLNAVQREYLKSHYSDCLCHDCLLAIKATVGNDDAIASDAEQKITN